MVFWVPALIVILALRLAWNAALFRFERSIKSQMSADRSIGGAETLPQTGPPLDPRAIDDVRVKDVLQQIRALPGGCPAWLEEPVQQVLSSQDPVLRSGIAGRLVRWLYSRASFSGDPLERRRLYNETAARVARALDFEGFDFPVGRAQAAGDDPKRHAAA